MIHRRRSGLRQRDKAMRSPAATLSQAIIRKRLFDLIGVTIDGQVAHRGGQFFCQRHPMTASRNCH
jgi:hypothetical protein